MTRIENIEKHEPGVIIRNYRNTCITLLLKIFQASAEIYKDRSLKLTEDLKSKALSAAQYAYEELSKWDKTKAEVQANSKRESIRDKHKQANDDAHSALTMIKQQNFIDEEENINLKKGKQIIFKYAKPFSFNELFKEYKKSLKKNKVQSK